MLARQKRCQAVETNIGRPYNVHLSDAFFLLLFFFLFFLASLHHPFLIRRRARQHNVELYTALSVSGGFMLCGPLSLRSTHWTGRGDPSLLLFGYPPTWRFFLRSPPGVAPITLHERIESGGIKKSTKTDSRTIPTHTKKASHQKKKATKERSDPYAARNPALPMVTDLDPGPPRSG